MLATLIIAVGMSTDAFAAALGMGAALKHLSLKRALRTGLVFGVVEGLTPLVGWAIGFAASGYIEDIDHWIAFLLLGGLGIKMIYEGLTRAAEAARPPSQSLAMIAVTAVATSLDALIVGVTLALIDADIIVTAIAIGLATFAMTVSGLMIGGAVGAKVGRYAETFGGIVLIAIGANILVQHLGG